MTGKFDFKKHAEDWTAKYREKQNDYASFAKAVTTFLRDNVVKEVKSELKFKVHTVEGREKSIGKFRIKVSEPSDKDPNIPKYPEPLSGIPKKGITDLSGSRVITFLLEDLQPLDRIIQQKFEVIERTDKFEALAKAEKFGYQGIHYLVKANQVTEIPDKEKYISLGLVAEIQIKTILEHAWAEIEHSVYDIRKHNPKIKLPPETSRRFQALAGLLEIADREFQNVNSNLNIQ